MTSKSGSAAGRSSARFLRVPILSHSRPAGRISVLSPRAKGRPNSCTPSTAAPWPLAAPGWQSWRTTSRRTEALSSQKLSARTWARIASRPRNFDENSRPKSFKIAAAIFAKHLNLLGTSLQGTNRETTLGARRQPHHRARRSRAADEFHLADNSRLYLVVVRAWKPPLRHHGYAHFVVCVSLAHGH